MQGHCDCASRYLKSLLKKSIKEKDPVAFDASLYLIQPFTIVASGISMLVKCIIGIYTFNIEKLFTLDTILFLLLVAVVTYLNIVFVMVEGKFSKKIGLYFLVFPLYSLTWIPIIIAGFFARHEKEWAHTQHTRNLEINDMNGNLEKAG